MFSFDKIHIYIRCISDHFTTASHVHYILSLIIKQQKADLDYMYITSTIHAYTLCLTIHATVFHRQRIMTSVVTTPCFLTLPGCLILHKVSHICSQKILAGIKKGNITVRPNPWIWLVRRRVLFLYSRTALTVGSSCNMNNRLNSNVLFLYIVVSMVAAHAQTLWMPDTWHTKNNTNTQI